MLFKNSRYLSTTPYSHNDTVVLTLRKRYRFNPDNFSFYTVIQGDTLDGIAYRLYGKAALWWAILDANPKYQSELEIKIGDVLKIPYYEDVVKHCG